MTAPEVIQVIAEANNRMYSMLFRVYTPTKNFREETEAQVRGSVERMLFHNSAMRDEEISIVRHDITTDHLNHIISCLGEKRALSVTSRIVGLGGPGGHLPMMDFQCDIAPENLEKIKEFLEKTVHVWPWGAILQSGRSYHFYGSQILTRGPWITFMAQSILFSGYTDTRWIAHQLIYGYSNLRISPDINGQFPEVVATFP